MSFENAVTPAQARAIAALMTSPTLGAAARVARVGERTLSRWLTQVSFQNEMARARTRLLADAALVLARGTTAAARALVAMASGAVRARSERVAAASKVIDLSLRFAELDDAGRRLSELEDAIAGMKPSTTRN